ncbi:MAG: glycosyltransferase family 4 protein [Planctomycetota bacterium]
MTRPLLVHVTTVPVSLLELFVGQIAYMKRMGFHVCGVCSSGLEVADLEAEYQVTVHPVEMQRAVTPIKDVVALVTLVRLFRNLRPAIVHCHTPKAGFLGSIAALLAGVPVRLYTIRGLRFVTASGFKRRVLKVAEKLACACAQRVPCNSRSLMDLALDEKVAPAHKTTVFGSGSGNGVDSERFQRTAANLAAGREVRRRLDIPSDGLVVGYVGRLVRDKGIVEMAAAWRGVREEFDHAHLLLVGPIEGQDPIPQEVLRELRSDARIHAPGWQRDTVPYYGAMDVVILPTHREGFPNALLEAAAMEIPVVATTVEGCVDAVLDNITGFLVPPRDPAALSRAISRLLRDAPLRRQMGQTARERVVREFRPEMIWTQLYREYAKLLTAKGLAVPGGAEPVPDRNLEAAAATPSN